MGSRSSRRRRGGPDSTGFALIVVLWTLVLIGFIIAHVTASGRAEIQIAGNLTANAVAEAAADGAIAQAIFAGTDPRPNQGWPPDGSVRLVTIGDSRVQVRLDDEAARINPNAASPALLEALLRALGDDQASARRLAGAIAEWVGSAAEPRPQEAVLADYRAAGLGYGPPGEPLETLDELGRVLGMTPPLLDALRPHLTLYGPADPNPARADPVVTAALALIGQAGQNLPAAAGAPEALTLRITATANGPGNARLTRIAIVRADATLPAGYAVLARWTGAG
jgi:general secretion pathway protein K